MRISAVTFPSEIGRGKVLRFTTLGDAVRPTDATRHLRGLTDEHLGPFAALAIVVHEGDAGYYLLYLDENMNAVTDTWHASLEHALHQAEFEYEGVSSLWTAVAEE